MKSQKNKEIDTIPFDREKVPKRQNLLLMPFIWAYSYVNTKRAGLRINKVNMKGLRPPYIVLGTHHSFYDFYVTPLALFPHRANYISELEGFEAYGEWIYRQVGCLGTRKFTNDMALIKNIKKVIDRKGIMVLYPEARYCNVGTNSRITTAVPKLLKMLDVPVVVLSMRGNYLRMPIWNTEIRKEAKIDATITQVLSVEDLRRYSVEEVREKIQEFFTYDDYRWQYETKQSIKYDLRAEGLQLPLYRCPNCNTEYHMNTKRAEIYCEKCFKRWYMTEYGRLRALEGATEYEHIPDWYEYERKCVHEEIDSGLYNLDVRVNIESLPNAVNFIELGEGRLRHDRDGFTLDFTEYGADEPSTLTFNSSSMTSCHTEYDYRGKGQCITLSTLHNTYFLYPLEKEFNVTKIQFATEYFYELTKEKK